MTDPQPFATPETPAGEREPARGRGSSGAVAMVLAAVVSVQFGGAVAATLLPVIGVLGSVTVRLALAAVLLCVLARPRVRGRSRQDWLTVVTFAVALALMNTAFYGSLARLPIGVAVTVEFLGPLVLAAVLSQRRRDLAAAGAALVGVLLITEVFTMPWAELDLIGIGLAATAGACWAAYIILSGRTGARFEGLDGVALCMAISTALVAPFGIASAGSELLAPRVLVLGLTVALLSSAIPYSLELIALRRLAAGVFGVLLSVEPAVAAVAGLVVLDQRLHLIQLVGMAFVIAASVLVLGGRAGTAVAEPPIGSGEAESGRMTG